MRHSRTTSWSPRCLVGAAPVIEPISLKTTDKIFIELSSGQQPASNTITSVVGCGFGFGGRHRDPW